MNETWAEHDDTSKGLLPRKMDERTVVDWAEWKLGTNRPRCGSEIGHRSSQRLNEHLHKVHMSCTNARFSAPSYLNICTSV